MFGWVFILLFVFKVLIHRSLRKSFEKIAKLRLGNDRAGCMGPISSILSPAYSSTICKTVKHFVIDLQTGTATEAK